MFGFKAKNQKSVFTDHGRFFSDFDYEFVKNYLHGFDAKWSYTGYTAANDGTRFWYCKLSDNVFFFEYCVEKIRSVVPGLGELRTVYGNGQTTNQPGSWHLDGYSGTTVLWYLDTFEKGWDGKTLFRTNQEIQSFTPRKNNLISFPAMVMHRSESPSIKCNLLRITLAWKFN